jgi:hypothetical protein
MVYPGTVPKPGGVFPTNRLATVLTTGEVPGARFPLKSPPAAAVPATPATAWLRDTLEDRSTSVATAPPDDTGVEPLEIAPP